MAPAQADGYMRRPRQDPWRLAEEMRERASGALDCVRSYSSGTQSSSERWWTGAAGVRLGIMS